jgi:hypothetical protein
MPDTSLLVKPPPFFLYNGGGEFSTLPATDQMYADKGSNQQQALQSVQDNSYLVERLAKLFNTDNALTFMQDPIMGGGHHNTVVNAETAGQSWSGEWNPLLQERNLPENTYPNSAGPSYEVLERLATLLFPEYAKERAREQFIPQYEGMLNAANKNRFRPGFDFYEQFQ